MRDEAIDYNRVFVVRVWLDAVGPWNEVDVRDFATLEEAIDYMDDGGCFREPQHWDFTFIDNTNPRKEG